MKLQGSITGLTCDAFPKKYRYSLLLLNTIWEGDQNFKVGPFFPAKTVRGGPIYFLKNFVLGPLIFQDRNSSDRFAYLDWKR